MSDIKEEIIESEHIVVEETVEVVTHESPIKMPPVKSEPVSTMRCLPGMEFTNTCLYLVLEFQVLEFSDFNFLSTSHRKIKIFFEEVQNSKLR